ncbi:late embryogenesis abundant hydroxyproline-rich glycoprotein family protein [Tanacetum coccineum]
MAITKQENQNQVAQPHSRLIRLIAIVLLVLIVIVGLTILIIWLTIKPKKLVYYIDDGSIHGYNLSNGNHLDASYYFLLRAYNPNKKVSVYYDKVDVSVKYDDKVVSRGTINPFYQPKRNTTLFKLNLASHDVILPDEAARDLKVDRSSGQVELGVNVRAKLRFKVGMWKSRHYRMKVWCAPIMVHLSSSYKGVQKTTFQSVKCDVDF